MDLGSESGEEESEFLAVADLGGVQGLNPGAVLGEAGTTEIVA